MQQRFIRVEVREAREIASCPKSRCWCRKSSGKDNLDAELQRLPHAGHWSE